MTTQLLGSGEMRGFDDALATHSSVPRGTQQGARIMDHALEGRRRTEHQSSYVDRAPEQNFELRAMQEKELIQRWFQSIPKPVLDHDPTLADVEQFVEGQLRIYFAARR